MKFNLFRRHANEVIALVMFFVGGSLSMLGMIQWIPLWLGIAGVVILASGVFYYCLKYTSEKAYKDYYKDSYDIEHDSIEEEIRKSMTYHRYQESVLNRFESACRDIGLSDEQRDWLLMLLMDEKNRVDEDLKNNKGGYI